MNETCISDLPSPAQDAKPRRPILSLKLERAEAPQAPLWVERRNAVYMVWGEGADMPKRLYGADERELAIRHAHALARKHGHKFHVMRSWRAFEAQSELGDV